MVDVSGVGYVLFCSGRTLGRLPGAREAVSLLVETHVREDHIRLFGFIDRAERDWFLLLGTVQGVGARMALAILSALTPEELIQAIAAQDKALLTRANGVGPKLAGRITAELTDKVGDLALGAAAVTALANGAAAGIAGPGKDAVSALVNLGYGRSEAFGAVAQASRRLGEAAPLEALVREGLKELAP
jgi:Holliday junction DNA helicase RuvA